MEERGREDDLKSLSEFFLDIAMDSGSSSLSGVFLLLTRISLLTC